MNPSLFNQLQKPRFFYLADSAENGCFSTFSQDDSIYNINMKTIVAPLLRMDKELGLKLVLLLFLIVGLLINTKMKSPKVDSIKISTFYKDQLGNFDQVHLPNKPLIIAKMISVLRPDFSTEKIQDVSNKIHQAFLKYKIEPQIVVAIIDTESSFNHDLVSSSGDLSLAQVNVEVWNKEFSRMNLGLIEKEKLKANEAYSLEVMAQILSILKKRYAKKDRRWYGRYHSKTEKHKRVYLSKLESRLKLLEKSQIVAAR